MINWILEKTNNKTQKKTIKKYRKIATPIENLIGITNNTEKGKYNEISQKLQDSGEYECIHNNDLFRIYSLFSNRAYEETRFQKDVRYATKGSYYYTLRKDGELIEKYKSSSESNYPLGDIVNKFEELVGHKITPYFLIRDLFTWGYTERVNDIEYGLDYELIGRCEICGEIDFIDEETTLSIEKSICNDCSMIY